MDLRDYLQQPHRFRWGGINGNDCMTFCARWIEHATGIDPIAHLRGSYSDAQGADRLIARAGGLVPLAANVLETRGFARTESPRDGDVGIVMAPAGLAYEEVVVKEVAAIRFGKSWAVIGPGGVIAKRLSFIAAWSIEPHA